LFLSNQDQNSLPNEKENATLNTFYKSILQWLPNCCTNRWRIVGHISCKQR
jgi:hypothetical protein